MKYQVLTIKGKTYQLATEKVCGRCYGCSFYNPKIGGRGCNFPEKHRAQMNCINYAGAIYKEKPAEEYENTAADDYLEYLHDQW